MKKLKESWPPKNFLFRLTFINIIIVSLFIVLSGLSIYNTACSLVEGMGTTNEANQKQFDSTLYYYLWIFSFIAIIIGSIIHYYLTKKTIRPLKRLTESTKSMKEGNYPKPLEVTTNDEIGQLTSHFNGLIQQLKNNHEHRQKLVTDLSHELRTPLSNLNGYLYALKNGVIEGEEELYQSLYEESERLTKMVTQLEILKEWDYISEQSFFEKETIDVHVLINQSVKMFYWQLENKSIPVDIDIEPAEIKIYKERILQAIGNLIDNAIQYYEGKEPLVIKGRKLENEYCISIIGSSQEIPIDNKDKIFERFYRMDKSRSRKTGGAGLGLSITKEIIAQHHGKIGYKSNGDKNTFWFRLPL